MSEPHPIAQHPLYNDEHEFYMVLDQDNEKNVTSPSPTDSGKSKLVPLLLTCKTYAEKRCTVRNNLNVLNGDGRPDRFFVVKVTGFVFEI